MIKKLIIPIISVLVLSTTLLSAQDVFETSAGGIVDKPLNRMWDVFGRVVDDAVYRWGNEPEYYEWMALKLMWSDLTADQATLRTKLVEWAQSSTGYVWSWTNEEGWPTHHKRHYTNNAKYILGAYRYFVWSGDATFLEEVDSSTQAAIFSNQMDRSEGRSMLEKLRLAMKYQLEELDGEDGLIRIPEGKSNGTMHGFPTDYWDNFRFGYLSAYVNTYFYASLKAMSAIETAVGNRRRADALLNLRPLTLKRFSETFWDEEKGRFIGCIGKFGHRRDFGFTYLNTEAMFYGLANSNQASRIFQWLDGERIIETDQQIVDSRTTGAVGADIYAFKWAPRSCTRAIESVCENGKYWWWDIKGAIKVGPGFQNASYGEHLENGGAIFYTSFYDVASRLKFLGADNAWSRFEVILNEFRIDELRRDPPNAKGVAWKWGIIGEYPESGLVPTVMIHAFMGLDATQTDLIIAPHLPQAFSWLAVKQLHFQGHFYNLKVHRYPAGQVDWLLLQLTGPDSATLNIQLKNLLPDKRFSVSTDSMKTELTSDAAGNLNFPVQLQVNETLRISRVQSDGKKKKKKEIKNVPGNFQLNPVYPNPFNGRLHIHFHLDQPAKVRLTVLDLRSRLVKTLFVGDKTAGDHLAFWDSQNEQHEMAASGIYFIQLKADGFRQVMKCLLVR